MNNDGLLADGQLRLNAILKNCKTNPNFGLIMTLIFNVTRVPDKGRPRTIKDFVKQVIDSRFKGENPFKGLEKAERTFNNLVGATTCYYYNWINGKKFTDRGIKIKEKKIISFLEENPQIIDVCLDLFMKLRKEDMPPTEYKTINGELHWRDRNNPQWKKCSLKQMTYLYNMELQGRKELNEKNEKLLEDLDESLNLAREIIKSKENMGF